MKLLFGGAFGFAGVFTWGRCSVGVGGGVPWAWSAVYQRLKVELL